MRVLCDILLHFMGLIYVIKAADIVHCSRDKSRTVRSVITKKILPIFETDSLVLPQSCPLNSENDMFSVHEENKYMENLSKWRCEFCGKQFMGERYLDAHFQNRHPEYVKQGPGIECLADYCDIFRCDVLEKTRKPDFWDMALCIEDEMKDIKKRCESLFKKCLPDNISQNQTNMLKDSVYKNVCNYLTCKKYWESPFDEVSSAKIAVYIVMSLFLSVGLLLYYCVAYHYFYTDTFSDSVIYDTPRPTMPHGYVPRRDIRRRYPSQS